MYQAPSSKLKVHHGVEVLLKEGRLQRFPRDLNTRVFERSGQPSQTGNLILILTLSVGKKQTFIRCRGRVDVCCLNDQIEGQTLKESGYVIDVDHFIPQRNPSLFASPHPFPSKEHGCVHVFRYLDIQFIHQLDIHVVIFKIAHNQCSMICPRALF